VEDEDDDKDDCCCYGSLNKDKNVARMLFLLRYTLKGESVEC
jgi:hypothetical protein